MSVAHCSTPRAQHSYCSRANRMASTVRTTPSPHINPGGRCLLCHFLERETEPRKWQSQLWAATGWQFLACGWVTPDEPCPTQLLSSEVELWDEQLPTPLTCVLGPNLESRSCLWSSAWTWMPEVMGSSLHVAWGLCSSCFLCREGKWSLCLLTSSHLAGPG